MNRREEDRKVAAAETDWQDLSNQN